MLTETEERVAEPAPTASQAGPSTDNQTAAKPTAAEARRRPRPKLLRLEWLGQTVASLCWIASVFVYGISSMGDWLQLFAASAWLVANIASAATTDAD